MGKTGQNKALFIFIITAFLAVQWSTAHIHLAAHHDHDGGHHQHASQGHLHALGNHHVDAIDVSHLDDHKNVVEIDYECTSPGWKKLDDHPDVLALANVYFEYPAQGDIVRLFKPSGPDSSWLAYSTVRLRAPPQVAS